MKPQQTLGLPPDRQMDHGLGLLADYERSVTAGDPKPQYLAAGLRSCFTALWRQQEVES